VIAMEDEIKVVLFKPDVMKAIEMYINQLLLKQRRAVSELEVDEDDNGDDVFTVTLRESPVEQAK
jgi:predicted XRE-type DNA-binding protein